ncbi:MAG: helix-turn-helix domain-containing protein [Phycisphaerales bacterium]|nr:helix-turn-helix domain-containing protein [Phycisphaerales bacterium]
MNTFTHAASGQAGPETAPGVNAELLDVNTVANLLDCSPRHVTRLSDTGRMPPPRKLGALVRWSRREVMNWIASGCPAVQSEGRAGR